jgi:CxxC motif-containing protein
MNTTCIVCPNGCQLTVKKCGKGWVVSGNRCERGAAYGREEATDPKRVVTCVVRTGSEEWPCVPVKTDQAVPKKMIPGLLKKLYSLRVKLPVRRGGKVIKDYNKTGINIVYTRSIPTIKGKR